ncbi:DNA-binding transcriptional regulator, MerR family [Krasilnikoviella flava]|uniref:DNA-binding transcriptional regulator, MerR family n=1 Tax=Krasilnikoviella flava TaxID=526729 RepID=A0A1T5LQL7_9MICO|nr:DNA-binding transcriptional regulator, MerR family [Krasilnikoviella flava]
MPAAGAAGASGTRTWSVGELAERFGLETHVLRYWEDVGLLAPGRDGAGRRRYGPDDVVRVATILSSKVAGMSLEQIQVLLDAEARDRHEVLTAHLAELDRRQEEIDRSRHMTEHALSCRAHDIATCPRFREHVRDLVDGTRTWRDMHPTRLVPVEERA